MNMGMKKGGFPPSFERCERVEACLDNPMTVIVNFARDGNAQCFTRWGWSAQEDEFVWTVGARSAIALPCLNSEAELEVEADVTGFDASKAVPLRLTVGDTVVADFRVTGRQTIKFRIPPRNSSAPAAALELEHPVFREDAHVVGDPRALAFCFRRISFQYTGEMSQPTSRSTVGPILVVGDSHIGALRQAYDTQDLNGGTRRIDVKFIGLAPGNSWARPTSPNQRYDPQVVEEIGQLGAELRATALFSTIYGNGHLIVGSIRQPRPFDFVIPGDESVTLPRDREIVPYALIRKKALNSSKVLLGFLSTLGRRLGVPAYHIAAPPPASDNERLSQYLSRAAATGGHDWLVSTVVESPVFRYKVWRVYEEAAREVVESEGGIYIPPPKEALDAAGFLTKRMEHDGFHANSLYGEAVLTQLSNVLHGIDR
jgi:hypothetical protein